MADEGISRNYVAETWQPLMSEGTVPALCHIIRAATYQKNDTADAEAISEAAEGDGGALCRAPPLPLPVSLPDARSCVRGDPVARRLPEQPPEPRRNGL